jgi:hypothetical protein
VIGTQVGAEADDYSKSNEGTVFYGNSVGQTY